MRLPDLTVTDLDAPASPMHVPPACEPRLLTKGDRIAATPCVVTIEKVTQLNAYGHCETCADLHVIDRRRYEAGKGPWESRT